MRDLLVASASQRVARLHEGPMESRAVGPRTIAGPLTLLHTGSTLQVSHSAAVLQL